MNTTVKKVIAYDGERKIVDSSEEERVKFIEEGIRPDFKDSSVLCIKFICVDSDNVKCDEDTLWYINRAVWDELVSMEREQTLDCIEIAKIHGEAPPPYAEELKVDLDYVNYGSFGPAMASEFLPEILTIRSIDLSSLLRNYSDFYNCLLFEDKSEISDEDKMRSFIEFLEEK